MHRKHPRGAVDSDLGHPDLRTVYLQGLKKNTIVWTDYLWKNKTSLWISWWPSTIFEIRTVHHIFVAIFVLQEIYIAPLRFFQQKLLLTSSASAQPPKRLQSNLSFPKPHSTCTAWPCLLSQPTDRCHGPNDFGVVRWGILSHCGPWNVGA